MLLELRKTKFLKCSPPIFDFEIGGYAALHKPESSASGALLYISNHLAYFLRSDLADILYKPKEFESVFAEI